MLRLTYNSSVNYMNQLRQIISKFIPIKCFSLVTELTFFFAFFCSLAFHIKNWPRKPVSTGFYPVENITVKL